MQPFPVTRIARLQTRHNSPNWLVNGLWGEQAVGFIGGPPKTGKTWLALELAVAVASSLPCLGRFAVRDPGHVLLYAAEDTAAAIKHRVSDISSARGVNLERLAVGLITAPELRLDLAEHQDRLHDTIEHFQPRMLVLDPLVRLHHGDENSAAEISALLSFLRGLQREHKVAIVVVHHVRKSSASQPGQALRGSGDLHAWSDSSLFLVPRKGRTELHTEHRFHPSLPPVIVALAEKPPVHLQLIREADNGQDVNSLSGRGSQEIRTRYGELAGEAPKEACRVWSGSPRRSVRGKGEGGDESGRGEVREAPQLL